MIKEDDFILKNNRKLYKMICNICGKDRGYKRNLKRNIEANCKSCSNSRIKNQDLFDNVDFNDFIFKNNNKKYKTKCVQCKADKGYSFKKDINKPCLSCSAKIRHKNMSPDIKKVSKIKNSCTQRGLDLESFDNFSTEMNERQRKLFKNSGLREECFKKYNYTCNNCGLRGVILNAHHIKSWKDYPDERFNLDNLICLCEDCHKQIHK